MGFEPMTYNVERSHKIIKAAYLGVIDQGYFGALETLNKALQTYVPRLPFGKVFAWACQAFIFFKELVITFDETKFYLQCAA